MKKIFYYLLVFIFVPAILWGAWPSDSVRTKNWGSEILTDSDLEAQIDLLHTYLNDSLDETTGHKHDGTANEGPLIDLDDDAGIIGVQGVLTVLNGGTGLATITDGGVLLGSGTGAITPMSVLSDGEIIVGDGTTDPVALGAFTSSTGVLKHENGGVEADISAIAKGGLITGTGTGTMGIKASGSDGTFIEYDSSAAGGIKASTVVTDVAFGSWASATIGSSTQASADSFVLYTDTSSTGGSGILSIKTDSSSPPTTVRCRNESDSSDVRFCMSPVKSGDYYLLECSGGCDGDAAFLIPLTVSN